MRYEELELASKSKYIFSSYEMNDFLVFRIRTVENGVAKNDATLDGNAQGDGTTTCGNVQGNFSNHRTVEIKGTVDRLLATRTLWNDH